MPSLQPSFDATAPRILCVSHRSFDPMISRCLRFEFEDLIASLDSVDIIAPDEMPIRSHRLRAATARLERSMPVVGRLTSAIRPARHYQMLYVGLQTLADLYTFAPWTSLLDSCDVSACSVDDVFINHLSRHSGSLEMLKRFDLLFVGCHGSVQPVAEITGRPVRYLPASVDALAFSPWPNPPKRVIDFYAMGRRPPQTHRALLSMADKRNWFYHFDTVSNTPFTDRHDHRRRLGDLIKRSRYFLANAARCVDPGPARAQQELGFRFFEGAAGGAVLIGDPPRNEVFNEIFGWQDSVVPLPFDSGDIADVIAELESDPVRVERIQRLNVANSLRRHDHVYRWIDVLDAAGMKTTPGIEQRRRALEERAASIERDMPALAPTPAAQPSRGAGALAPAGTLFPK
jgi:Glycosyl transferases group 1